MGLPETAKLGLAFGASLISFKAKGQPRPFSASLAVTNRCNLRCAYCNTPFLDQEDLPLDQIEIILRRLRSMGVRRLGLLGGEPLVRKDLPDLIALAKAMGFYVSLNSNLTLYHRRKKLFDGVDLVMTSLDGDPETHRKNRGKKSFDGILEATQDLLARKKPVVAITVLTENNLDQVEHILQRGQEIGFNTHFQPQCSDTAIVRGEISESLGNERLRSVWVRILEAKRAGRPVASSKAYLRAQSQWQDFRISSYTDASKRCAAGYGYLYVDPQGLAYPCAYTKEKTAPVNLLEKDWQHAFGGQTPCTWCNVGPMMEFNLLFTHPVSSSLSALAALG